MKKLLFFLSIIFFFSGLLRAQDDELPPPSSKLRSESSSPSDPDKESFKGFRKPKKVDWSKFIIEPNFNIAIAQDRIDLGLAPYIGYEIFRAKNLPDLRLYAGGGLTYFYTGYSGFQVTDNFGHVVGTANAHYHTYGGGTFLQCNIWNGLFTRVKFEVLHRTMDDINSSPIPRNPNNYSAGFYFPRIERTIPALLVGAGYNMLRSKNFFFPVLVSYNVLSSITEKQYSIYPHGWVIQLGFVNVF